MKDLLQKIAKEANAWYPNGYPSGEGGDDAWKNLVIFKKEDLVTFTELIAKVCVSTLRDMHQWQSVNNQNYPSSWHDAVDQGIDAIKEQFGVEE